MIAGGLDSAHRDSASTGAAREALDPHQAHPVGQPVVPAWSHAVLAWGIVSFA
jgi:hypothetical protein